MITTISRFAPPEPTRPYEPDKVSLGTKLTRHLRRKGWKLKECIKQGGVKLWQDSKDQSFHTLAAAVRIQLHREGYCDDSVEQEETPE
jgi:hypothetical protein